jgi:uncharacterized protein
MRALFLAAVCAACLVLPGRALAQPGAISESHLAVAREVLARLRLEESAMAAAVINIDQQMAANPAMAPFREVMVAWARSVFASEEARTGFATLYAERLSEEDLRALLAFYDTPAGRHLAEQQPALIQAGAELGRRLAESRQPDLQMRLEKRMRELQETGKN